MKKRKIISGLVFMFVLIFMMPLPVSAASKLKLNKTSVSTVVGMTVQLKVNNTSKTVKWSSSKKSVATVDSNGLVTAKKAGTATIVAKAGSKKLTCKIKVKSNVWKNSDGGTIEEYSHSSWENVPACYNSKSYSVYAQPLQFSFNSKGEFTAKIMILNNTKAKKYSFSSLSVTFKDSSSGKIIAEKTFHFDKKTISPLSTITFTLNFAECKTHNIINLRKKEVSWTVTTN